MYDVNGLAVVWQIWQTKYAMLHHYKLKFFQQKLQIFSNKIIFLKSLNFVLNME